MQPNDDSSVPKRARSWRPTPAFALAFVALFVGLGGGAFAANQIAGKQIKDGSVTGKDIKNESLTPKDFSGSVRGKTGSPGLTGPAGPRGATGAAPAQRVTYVWRLLTVNAMSTEGDSADCLAGQTAISGGASAHDPGAVMTASYPINVQGGAGWVVEMQNTTPQDISLVVWSACAPGTSSFPQPPPPQF